MPPVGTPLASESAGCGCPSKGVIHKTRGSAWWHACHQVVPTREWTPASQRPNVLKYEVREKRRSGKKGRKAETTGGEEAQWVANAKVRRGVRRASSERKAASESKNRRIMIPHPSWVLLAISVHGNCLTYICVTLARFVHAHTHGLRRRGLHTNLWSSRRPTSATRVALGAGPCRWVGEVGGLTTTAWHPSV